ncbi:hypothetical protein [Petroclostridium sp. X23]|uniref:hypothetical protein n=1 Tax=Petroclostridium sp. X23 TaxID=3045146 RepID=UPI0024AD1133|nr:hypothetical protein [Petroclostridium sp. X23]WHH58471.1 hypothetical protein QKW49_22160 [Petroclostridium sp. X23]
MKCTYACNVEQVNQNRYEFDDDGRNTFHEHKLIELKHYIECLKEECGAWYDGRCHYSDIKGV